MGCEEVANRKNREGPEGGLTGTNKELWHTEAQHQSIVLSKKKKKKVFFWGLRVWNTDKIQVLSILNERGCLVAELVPQQTPERGWGQLPAVPDGAGLGTE